MKIKAEITIVSMDQKIETIKLLRSIFRLGLVEAKTLCENKSEQGYFTVHMNAEQFARLVIHDRNGSGFDSPYLIYKDAEILTELTACYDFSSVVG